MTKWVDAWAAICGRWVMHSTWERPQAGASLLAHDRRRAAADAGIDLVEDRASVRACVRGASSVLIASMIRDSSPPEAIRASGRGFLADVGRQ